MLVGQEVLDPPEGYATRYSSSQAQTTAAVVIPLSDTFHSFKRLLGKRCAYADMRWATQQALCCLPSSTETNASLRND